MFFFFLFFFFSSRRRHTRLVGDWSSDVCSSDLGAGSLGAGADGGGGDSGAAGHEPTQSPTRAGPPVSVPTAVASSAEVILSLPTGVVIRRITRPVAGSLISRPGRITSYSPPTRTPAPAPAVITISAPDTSATRAWIATLVS